MSVRTAYRLLDLSVRVAGAGLGALALSQPYVAVSGPGVSARYVTLFELRPLLRSLGHAPAASAVLLVVLFVGFGSVIALSGWQGGVIQALGWLLFAAATAGGAVLGTDVAVSYRIGFYLSIAASAVTLLAYLVPAAPPRSGWIR